LGALPLIQDFHFGFLVLCKRTSKLVARGFLLTKFNSGQPAVRVERHPCRPGKLKTRELPSFKRFPYHPYPFFFRQDFDLPAPKLYPAGAGSASIRRTMLPN
jgi:hypothetical protein